MSETIENKPREIQLSPVLPPMAVVDLGPCARAVHDANALVIDSADMLQVAVDECASVLRRADALEALRATLKKPFLDGGKTVDAWFRKPAELLGQADQIYKQKIRSFKAEQERKRREDEARAEEAARKERERLQREAEKAEAKGRVEKAEALRDVAASIPTAVVSAPAPKAQGSSSSVRYKAECTDKAKFLGFVVANPHFLHLVVVDSAALNAQARAMKEAFALDGCRLVKDEIESIRR